MQLTAIQTTSALEALAGEWNDLLSQSASHVPFLRHEFLSAWWNALGGGEWRQAELFIVTGREADGSLAGIAPLFFTQNQAGQPVLMLLGSHEICDYLDLIVRPAALPRFAPALLEFLSSPAAPPWQALDLYNLLDNSPTLPALRAAVQGCGWKLEQTRLKHCPYIPLPGDWEAYLAGIDKKQRHEIRRKMRRAAESAPGTRWYIVDDESQLTEEIDAFLDLMAQDGEKARFLTPEMRRQMHLSLRAAFQSGWLQLAFLEIGDQKAAAYCNFDFNHRIWVYNSGLDFSQGALSPGWVLLGHLLQWANEHGRAVFDFMRGDEEYKYRFGGVDRFVLRVTVER